MLRRISATIALALLSATTAFAQPLADRLPSDTLVYVGWAGTDNLGKDYPASHLKAVLDASEFANYVNDYLPKLAEKVGHDTPCAPISSAMGAMASVMLKHPSAIAITDIKVVDDKAVPRMVIICDAGEDAAGLKQQLSTILDAPGGQLNTPVSIRTIATGNIVALAIGYGDTELVLAGPADDNAYRHDPLSGTDAFNNTMQHLQATPASVGYVDVDGLFKIVERQLNRGVDVKDPAAATHEVQQWEKFSEALGLKGLHHIAGTSALDGQNWSTVIFIDAPAPRAGLVGLLDNGPVAEDFLKVIPKTAVTASAGRFDFSKLFVEIRQTLGKISPETKARFDSGVGMVPTLLGFDIKPDLLDALGDHWACYADRNTGGSGLLGTVVVNRVRNPEKLEETLGQIEKFVSTVMMAKQAAKPGKITLQQGKAGDLTVHYLASPIAAPSWAISDGNLYLGLYPQVVAAAASQVANKQPSIYENQGFIALQDRLHGKKFTGMQFLDLPQTAGDSYGWILLATRSIQGAGDMTGDVSPMMVVPPLPAILPHLNPAGFFTSADASGWYLRNSSPFPGSEIFAASSCAGGPVIAGFILPVLGRIEHQHMMRHHAPAAEPAQTQPAK